MGPTRPLKQDEVLLRRDRKEAVEAIEKDEAEQRLEKLLFGDEAGFLSALTTRSDSKQIALRSRQDGFDETESADGDRDMEDAPDEELFFLDAGTGDVPFSFAKHMEDEEDDSNVEKNHPLWLDSDDERLTISLATNTRLRKLRDTESDDVINGTEYIRRLRRQYERLHPTPEWVKYARKKRRLSNDTASDSDSDTEIDGDISVTTTQPLSELLRSAGSLVQSSTTTSTSGDNQGRKLGPETIDIARLKDVTGHGPSSIDSMQFHPYFPLLLSAGPSSTINLYHISPQPPNPNPLLTSLHLKNTPLHTAAFCRPQVASESREKDDTRIFLSSRRRYFHTWSLSTGAISKNSRPIYGTSKHEQKTMEAFKLSPCGRYMGLVGSGKKGGGLINVLSTDTMQWICSCRIDSLGGVADFAWWRNGEGFVVVGKSGEVSEYEIESRQVVARWTDEGAVGTTTIALGGDSGRTELGSDRWVAIGSSSGVVNIYDRRSWTTTNNNTADNTQNSNNISTSSSNHSGIKIPLRPTPTRTLDHLTTPTSHLHFSQDGQMLVVASRWKKNALRLVHLPTCTVYKNWPTDKTPLGKISSIALSQDGALLAVANEQGRIRLWQIRT